MSLSKKVVLTVSGYKISLSDSLQFYQNDQLKLIFEINKYGIDVASSFAHKTLMPLQPLTATLFIETPSGVDSIESANIEDNAVTFYLTSNQTQHIGTSTMQIKLTDDDGCQITLPSFTFEVQKNIYDNAVHVSGILLADENDNVLSDENGNTINATATTESSKQIKDFSLKTGVSGQEDILVQDNGVTKRIKSSELIDTVDLTGYATETYVQNKIAEASLSGGEVDLSGYATKTELNTKANVSHTHTKSDITDLSIPTKTSQLTNDSGYITSVPSEYVTETKLSNKNYATETYVQNKIAEASLSGGEVDLSGYATKEDLNTKADKSAIPTKVSQLTNDKGYLTSHQDISGKADKTYVDTELAKKANSSHTHSYNDLTDKPTIPSISNLATKTELTNGLETKADKTELNSKANTNHTHSQYLTTIPQEYVTETELNSALSTKANTSDIPSLDGYATETFVTNKIAEASLSSGEVDLSGLATKDELTSGLATKANTEHTHSQYLTTIPQEYITETELEAKGYLTEHQDLSNYALASDLHSHSNKTQLDSITANNITNWNRALPFIDSYVEDCNSWLTNGYTKTNTSTLNHPSLCTGVDRWGVLFYISENVANRTGTQMYFPIDGAYAGRIFTRRIMNGTAGDWNLVSTFDGNYNSLTNKPTIPTIDVNKSYVDTQLANKSDKTHNHDTVYSKLDHNHTGMLTSNSITRIEVVDALPGQQENGVLYIVKGE